MHAQLGVSHLHTLHKLLELVRQSCEVVALPFEGEHGRLLRCRVSHWTLLLPEQLYSQLAIPATWLVLQSSRAEFGLLSQPKPQLIPPLMNSSTNQENLVAM